MKRLSKIMNLKVAALFFVACSFLFAPLASALHTDDQINETCTIEFDGSTYAEAVGDDGHAHDHHAHHCGPCHVHLYRPEFNTLSQLEATFARLRPPLEAGKVSSRINDLYRPPKP